MIRTVILTLLVSTLSAGEVATLTERLTASDRTVQLNALIELARKGPSSPRDMEIARLRISELDPAIRMSALGVATRLKDDGAIAIIIANLRHADSATAKELSAALRSICGSDIGGVDAGRWADWHEELVRTTAAGIAAVRAAVAANDSSKARSAMHPLLMQRAGRDQVVNLLGDLVSTSKDPRMVALAREGLVTLDTGASRSALAAQTAAGSSTQVETATPTSEQPTIARVGPVDSGALAIEVNLSSVSGMMIATLLGLIAMVVGGLLYAKRWLQANPKIAHATRMFVLKSRKIYRR